MERRQPWWWDDKLQMILNTYLPRRTIMVSPKARPFVEAARAGRLDEFIEQTRQKARGDGGGGS
jgi:hypothetical protein